MASYSHAADTQGNLNCCAVELQSGGHIRKPILARTEKVSMPYPG